MIVDSQPDFQEQFSKFKVCVIIPTFNNQNTLKRVIDGVLHYTNDIIIVNDGSTDDTFHILKDYSNLIQIHFSKNKGKGAALREGFKKLTKLVMNLQLPLILMGNITLMIFQYF